MENIIIRETGAADFDAIMAVEKQGFGYTKEAELTAALLQDKTAEPRLSLLALQANTPVGHILFTRAYVADRPNPPLMHILAPLAVIPAYQRKGVGGRLIAAGLERLRAMGSQMVFVLGHKEYYPRHGFLPHVTERGFDAPHPIPAEFSAYWMYQPLLEDGSNIAKGRLVCADTLNAPQHWRDDDADKQ